VEQFERAIAERVGAAHVVAFANATAALHGAASACGVGPGDVGVTQAITFCASANMFRYCGGDVAFCDIYPDTVGCDPRSLAMTIEREEAAGRRVKAVVPVHMGGLSTNAKAIREAAGSRFIIEDASHALGASDDEGRPVGSCAHADISVFSFHPVKPITSGEGGVAATNDASLADRLRLFRNHGIEKRPDRFTGIEARDGTVAIGPWYYEQQELGYNYRLSDLHAALGLSQLAKLDTFIQWRRELAARYDVAFATFSDVRPLQAESAWRARSSHHLYLVMIDFAALGISRRDVMGALQADGVWTQVHYIPVYRQPYYQTRNGLRLADFPNAERYYGNALTLPLHPGMTNDDVDYVVASLRRAIDSPSGYSVPC
jgi:perosamine synthetase